MREAESSFFRNSSGLDTFDAQQVPETGREIRVSDSSPISASQPPKIDRDLNPEIARRALEEQVPDLAVEPIEHLGSGWERDVYLVNRRLVVAEAIPDILHRSAVDVRHAPSQRTSERDGAAASGTGAGGASTGSAGAEGAGAGGAAAGAHPIPLTRRTASATERARRGIAGLVWSVVVCSRGSRCTGSRGSGFFFAANETVGRRWGRTRGINRSSSGGARLLPP